MSATTRFIRECKRQGLHVQTRRQWGSKHLATYQWRRINLPHGLIPRKPVDTLWCHITVTFDDGVLVGDFKRDMQEVERIGMQRFGSGFSYNIGIDCVTGMAGLGQSLDAKGTHTVNTKKIPGYSYDQNKVSLAVAFIGMPGDKPSARAKETLIDIMVSLILSGNLTFDHDFNPHSMVAAKDCPTDAMRAIMPECYSEAQRRVTKIRKDRLAAKRSNR